MSEQIKSLINSIINDNQETASLDFHAFLAKSIKTKLAEAKKKELSIADFYPIEKWIDAAMDKCEDAFGNDAEFEEFMKKLERQTSENQVKAFMNRPSADKLHYNSNGAPHGADKYVELVDNFKEFKQIFDHLFARANSKKKMSEAAESSASMQKDIDAFYKENPDDEEYYPKDKWEAPSSDVAWITDWSMGGQANSGEAEISDLAYDGEFTRGTVIASQRDGEYLLIKTESKFKSKYGGPKYHVIERSQWAPYHG